MPVIDNAEPSGPNVSTSVDCYVSGQYLGRNGQTIEVTQRYTVFAQYGKNTQAQTVNQIRDAIINDFNSRFGRQFNVANVYVPGLPIPKDEAVKQGVAPGEVAPVEFYYGSGTFRDQTRYARLRWDIGTQNKIRDVNVRGLKDRYKYR
jgi:hypothetical protein